MLTTAPLHPLLCLASLALLPAALKAQTQPEPLDKVQLRAGLGYEHDNNVLRAPSGNRQADNITNASAGIKLDVPYSRQRFTLDAQATAYRYDKLSYLDWTGLDYTAAWNWSFGNDLDGVLSADRREYRDVTDIATSSRINRRTDRNELFEARYKLDGAWRLLGGFSHASSENSDPAAAWDASPSVTSTRIGAAYEFASGSSIATRLRHGRGEYRNPPAGIAAPDFRENEADVSITWPVTGKTTLEGRLGYLDREHPGQPRSDFSGVVGQATVNWAITAKTRLVAGLARDLSSYQGGVGSHIRSNRIFISPIWKPTVKTAVRLRYQRDERSWQDAPVGAPDAGRRDVAQLTSAIVEWEPWRALTVSGSVSGERRKSNLSALNYRSTTIAAGVTVHF